MLKWSLISVCFLWAVACVAAEPLRIATWNVRNYLLSDRYLEGRFRPAYPMPEAQKEPVRHWIETAAPTVLFLQEMGDASFLTELQWDLQAEGVVYPHAYYSGRPDARSGLAVLSKIPLDRVILHEPKRGGDGFSPILRGVQEVIFHKADVRFQVFHVHLKSRYSEDPSDPESLRFREAEMAALVQFLFRATREAADYVLLLGDFNAPREAPILDALKSEWEWIPAVDAKGEAWTYYHYRTDKREVLDGVWVPEGQADKWETGRIFPDKLNEPAPSDHRMVVVEHLN